MALLCEKRYYSTMKQLRLLDKTPEEIVESQNQRLHPLDALSLPEVHFLRWCISQKGYHCSRARRYAMGKEIMWTEFGPADMTRLQGKIGWRELYIPMRLEQEHYMKRGKQIADSTIPLATKVWRKALKKVNEELDSGDAMGAARAAPALVAPALAQVWPKKDEGGAKVQVINLTQVQTQGLSSPSMIVTAEEIKAEEIVEAEPE